MLTSWSWSNIILIPDNNMLIILNSKKSNCKNVDQLQLNSRQFERNKKQCYILMDKTLWYQFLRQCWALYYYKTQHTLHYKNKNKYKISKQQSYFSSLSWIYWYAQVKLPLFPCSVSNCIMNCRTFYFLISS